MMTRTQINNQWMKVFKPAPNAKLRLFCLPFAGGGGQFFRDWHEYLPKSIELCAIQLPGRESRIREKPMTSLADLVNTLVEALKDQIKKPYAIFGHSMGALIGYEFIRAIRRNGLSQPRNLVVSCRKAPHLPEVLPLIHNLPDDQFIEEIKNLNGTPKEIMDSQELLKLIMPVLRTDIMLCETYTYHSEPSLDCTITAYGGLQDHTVSRDEVDAWRQHTAGSFTIRMFPGDHFFIQTSRALFFQFLTLDLLSILKNI
jgi:medium-chain acyl-[acyl-carrier-protein] hydrolase